MKIKVTNRNYSMIYGLEFDAAVSPNKKFAAIYDSQNLSWFLNENEFEIIESNQENDKSLSLIQSIGEKPKRIEIEF